MKERMRWIDIAKGICILAVIIGHQGMDAFGFVYSFSLPTFFLLSGYTLRPEPLSAAYAKNKFVRLMVPYFLTCLAVVCMEVVNSLLVAGDCSTTTVTSIITAGIYKTFFASGTIKNFGWLDFGRVIGAVWFLPAMYFGLLITQYLLNRIPGQKAQCIAAVLIFTIAGVTANIAWLPYSLQAAAFCVPFILLGYMLRRYSILEERLKVWHYLLLAAVFVCIFLWGYAEHCYLVTCNVKDWGITLIGSVCSSLVVIGVSRALKKFPPLEFFGKNSLVVLCAHLFEMNTLYWVYSKASELLGIPQNAFIKLGIRLVMITVITAVLLLIKHRKTRLPALAEAVDERDRTVDVMRFILISLMIIGHASVDRGLRDFIFSFHMMAFVMVSGYFYRPNVPFGKNLLKTLKSLVPYGLFCLVDLLLNHERLGAELLRLVTGISYSKNILTSIPTVGPVYFILLLFCTRLIYLGIDRIKDELWKNAAVLAVFMLGIWLGEKGYWLPWSLDCAMFSLLFYHIAHYMRKYQLLEKSRQYPWLYFPLAFVWMYMIRSGAMEVSVRRYVNSGLTVVGVVCAFVILYMLCSWLCEKLPAFIVKIMSVVGQSTAYILILHTCFWNEFPAFVQDVLGLNQANIYHLGVNTVLQLALGTVCFLLVGLLKRGVKTLLPNKRI